MVMVMQATITLITVFVIFQIPCHGPIAWFIVLTLFQGLAGMSFGFFLSTVCNREFITPGMICVAIFFLAMALTSESFITERSQGLLERSWITGVLPVEIIASYIMSQFLVMVVQATITLI